jgi:phosphoribosyl 1,2-cyclic phosphate phosphodiesterase
VKITVLGCGGSGGVPLIGGNWGACDPGNPKNRRRRVSVLVEDGDTTLLIDTSPDLREQLLDAGVRDISAVLWTHAHADHMNGIDDLRSVNRMINRPLPVYGSAETLEHVRHSFGYVLRPIPEGEIFYKPYLVPHEITGPFRVGAVDVLPIQQDHGYSKTLGFRIGTFAYSTDVVRLSDEAFEQLAGLDLWIVDGLRATPHPTHSHIEQTLSWIERLAPKRAILTHMNETVDYGSLAAQLPPGVEPGYDGLVIAVPE